MTRSTHLDRAVMALGAALLLSPSIDGASGAPDHDALIARIREAPDPERRRLVHELAAAGPSALEATRKARDGAPSAEVKEALSRAVLWQVAAKITPALEESVESQLTYDGQFTALGEAGPETGDALLALAEDAATSFPLRITALRALADVAGPGRGAEPPAMKLRLKALHYDVLAPEAIRDQAGILLAILGETYILDAEIARLEELVSSEDIRDQIESNLELSNLYYRIRGYEEAVKCYEKVLKAYEQILELQRRQRAPNEVLERIRRELGLHYYNAACSSSLAKDIEKAKTFLKKAVELDPIHFSNMEKDGDLANLRKDPGYAAFRKEIGKPFEKAEF